MAAPVQRLVFRAQVHNEGSEIVENALHNLQLDLAQRVADDQILTLSLFSWRRNLFLYYECPGETILPSDPLGPIEAELSIWPGEVDLRHWVPMMDVFHFNSPQSIEHWRRDKPPQERTARVIYLRPEMVSSYIFYHYQMQEEKPGCGDKYGQISLHENLLFFCMEKPATTEAARHEGQLKTTNTPPDWHAVMVPHFQPWNDDDGEELWRASELIYSL